jgi:hypothetical protein
MKGELAKHLQPSETVLQALKRLGGGGGTGGGRGGGGRAARGKGGNQKKTASIVSPENREAFAKITELSSTLMSNGGALHVESSLLIAWTRLVSTLEPIK